MKTMKKVLAFMLALAMVVTAVPVTNAEAATGLPKSKSYYAGKTYTLKLTTPSSWKSVSTVWSATNNNTKAVAISDKKAKSVTVKALKKGKAVVTAKVTYKKSGVKTTKTYKCNVRVKAPTISVSPKAVTVDVDKTVDLKTTFVPASGIVTYESEDEQVAAVKATSTGAVVSGVSAGETNIKAYLRCGKKVKMSIVKVTVTGEKLEDGLSAKITNTFLDYENTVVADTAYIRFYYGKGGKGISGKTISYVDGVVTNSAVTDANGYAFLPVAHPGIVAKRTYTATVVATGEKVTGTISFAEIGYSDLWVVNGSNNKSEYGNGKKYKDELGYKDLAVSENDVQGATKGNGKTVTSNTYSVKNNNGIKYVANREFVDSQQVSSKGTDNHKVGFDGGLPTITLPGDGDTVNKTQYFNQPINFTSKEYHVYDSVEEWFEVEVKPDELLYATMNFENLNLSKYTHMEVSTYNAKGGTQVGTTTFVYGPTEQKNFGYQIPLTNTTDKHVWVKVVLKAAGQVDTGKNKGYTIKDITGVYRADVFGTANKVEVLKNAKITWEKTTPVMSVERELTNAIAAQLNKATDVTLQIGAKDEATEKVIARMTYKVPVYPYTGNAVITTYDKNGSVIAYFACPTVNAYYYNSATKTWVVDPEAVIDTDAALISGSLKNYNVLSNADYTYRISEDEANKSVGTVTQDGSLVTVNSEEAGVTTLVGTISGLDVEAINEKVYTSVQWCPIPNEGPKNNTTGAIALAGQTVEVIAQLFDTNGNKVAKAGEPISFKYLQNGVETVIADKNNRLTYLVSAAGSASATVQAVDAQVSTDSKGQAKMILCASEVASLVGIVATTNAYNVAISVNGENVSKLDLYWVKNVSQFTDKSIDGTTTVNKNVTASAVPTVGEKWEYGFTTTAVREDDQTTRLPNAGIWANYCIKRVENLKIALGVEAGSTGTVTTDTGVNGMALVTSTKNAKTLLSSTVDGTPVAGEQVKFVIRNDKDEWWTETSKVNVGTGVANSTKMVLDIDWESTGLTGNFITINGTKADINDTTFDVYFKVTDSFGNVNSTDIVEVTSSLSGSIKEVTSAAGLSGTPVRSTDAGVEGIFYVQGSAVAADEGKIKITLNNSFVGGTKTNGLREMITVKVNGVSQTIQIVWTNAGAFVINHTNVVNGNYLSYADAQKIVLTFTDLDTVAGKAVAVNASTVDKSQFTVKRYRDDNSAADTAVIDIASVTVSGNQIILTFRTPYTDNKKLDFDVAIKAADDGRVITSSEGKVVGSNGVVTATKISYTK